MLLNIESDVSTRRGAYADISLLTPKGSLARLDFISGDRPSSDSVDGILVSRVYLEREALINLRDTIDAYLNDRSEV